MTWNNFINNNLWAKKNNIIAILHQANDYGSNNTFDSNYWSDWNSSAPYWISRGGLPPNYNYDIHPLLTPVPVSLTLPIGVCCPNLTGESLAVLDIFDFQKKLENYPASYLTLKEQEAFDLILEYLKGFFGEKISKSSRKTQINIVKDVVSSVVKNLKKEQYSNF